MQTVIVSKTLSGKLPFTWYNLSVSSGSSIFPDSVYRETSVDLEIPRSLGINSGMPVHEERQPQGERGDQNIGSYIAEDVAVQGCAMNVGALSVPQANGVVRGAGDEGTRGEAWLVVVLYLWVHLRAGKINL